MVVAVMKVGIVGVGMDEPHMIVPMRVRFARRIRRAMCMLVMLVVNVAVFVSHGLVNMFVRVPLCQM